MQLRVVPTKAHAAVDQVVGPTLILAPELFRLKAERKESLVPRVMGATEELYSNLTDYELAVKRVLPMRAHLALDAVNGALLGASPWALGTARRGRRHWLPHAIVGAAEIGLALTTKTEPPRRRRLDGRLKAGARLARQPAVWKAAANARRTAAPAIAKARRELDERIGPIRSGLSRG